MNEERIWNLKVERECINNELASKAYEIRDMILAAADHSLADNYSTADMKKEFEKIAAEKFFLDVRRSKMDERIKEIDQELMEIDPDPVEAVSIAG